MSEHVIQNIKDILVRRHLTAEKASLLCGLDRSYFRKLFERSVGSPRGATLDKIANGLQVSIEEILTGTKALSPGGQRLDLETFLASPNAFPADIPIKGTAAGSHKRGAFQLGTDDVGYVRRPPGLIGATGVYGLYVEGDSMDPQYPHGTFLLINPHKPFNVGDGIIVQTRTSEHSEIESTLGVFVKQSAEKLVIHKHNPVDDIEFPRSLVWKIHKVLTSNEILGV